MNTFQKLCSVLNQQFGISEQTIELGTQIENLNMDSLGLVDLIMALEQTFNIEIDDEKISQAKTIGDVVKLIDSECSEN
ncbi:MAG: acyl carrier protein [Oscillospiraceae bacterium]|nr:acyl carrier protein [Oscillospiraceae bacterium]